MNFKREIIRPSNTQANQISFYFKPDTAIVELVHDYDDGLRFAIYERGNVQYAEEYAPKTAKPLGSLLPLIHSGTIRLPSLAAHFSTIGQLAERKRRFIRTYFDCEPEFESVAVLYALHTWVYEAFNAVPYLRFLGLLGSGKTRGMMTVGALCYRPVVISGVATGPALFRTIEIAGGTVLLDESDFQNTSVGADIIKVLNMGYQKGLPVIRNEPRPGGNGFDPTPFDVFGPKIISGRRKFRDEATESRCLSYMPRQTTRTDIPLQLPEEFEREALEISNEALMFRFLNLESISPSAHREPDLSPRTCQIIQPLLELADRIDADNAGKVSPRSYREDLLTFAKVQDLKAKDEQKATVEYFLLEAFLNHNEDAPLVSDLARECVLAHKIDDPKLEYWLNPRRTGQLLREIGFETPHSNKGSKVVITPEKLASLKKRFGIAG
ncbi:MAG: hypothetical protein JST93_02405 [Acidobacteria bacterium]|nr:hypothetical protein [Acidobacteriota bacterium]